jgi:hypothetical protein
MCANYTRIGHIDQSLIIFIENTGENSKYMAGEGN